MKEEWISDVPIRSTNKKFQQIKLAFHQALQEQTTDVKTNYYDFLLVAKKLGFRFQQSSHLMALKNYFAKNKGLLPIKKLAQLLCITSDSLNSAQQKIVVKFSVPQAQFDPIKQVTNEDQQNYGSQDGGNLSDFGGNLGSSTFEGGDEQLMDKITIILSIKLEQMSKKLKMLINQVEDTNMFTVFLPEQQIDFQNFKKGILKIITQSRFKIKMSEDDIKTIFNLLDNEKTGTIKYEDLEKLKKVQVYEQMKEYYFSRINKDMVKNTLFKLGRAKDSGIQVFQLKNASVLEFKQMEQSMINVNKSKISIKQPKRIPHFGPLKGASKFRKAYATQSIRVAHSQQPISNTRDMVERQREKIERILKNSKEQKKRNKSGQTVASKLRSLFIHKVILPRQKMLAEQKQRFQKIKSVENQLAIRPTK